MKKMYSTYVKVLKCLKTVVQMLCNIICAIIAWITNSVFFYLLLGLYKTWCSAAGYGKSMANNIFDTFFICEVVVEIHLSRSVEGVSHVAAFVISALG